MSFAKNAADAISAARDAAVGEATGADESDAAKSKRRRIVALLASLGALGAVGTAGYYGYKNKDTLIEKGRRELESLGAENGKPGFFGRLGDKLTDWAGMGLAGAASAAAPGLTRSGVAGLAKLKVPGMKALQSTATNRWAHQRLGEKVKTVVQRVLMGPGEQNTASGLTKRLEEIAARDKLPTGGEGGKGGKGDKGGSNTSGKVSDFFADPHTRQAEVIAKRLGPQGTQGLVDVLRKDLGRSVSPAADQLRLKKKVLAPLHDVQTAGLGGNKGLRPSQRNLAEVLRTPGAAGGKKLTDPTARGVLLNAKAPIMDYAPAYRFSPRRLAGHAGRGILGVLANATAGAWSEPKEAQ
jgi:hypothetical protein